MKRAVEQLSRTTGALGGLAVLTMFVAVTNDIARRNLGMGTQLAFDLSELLMVPLVYLSLAYVASVDGNIRIKFLNERLPARWQRVLDMVSDAVLLVFAALLTWRGGAMALHAFQQGSVTPGRKLPQWPALAAIPVGGAILMVQLVLTLWLRARRR